MMTTTCTCTVRRTPRRAGADRVAARRPSTVRLGLAPQRRRRRRPVRLEAVARRARRRSSSCPSSSSASPSAGTPAAHPAPRRARPADTAPRCGTTAPTCDDGRMKVRIGVGLGVRTTLHGPEFGRVRRHGRAAALRQPVAVRADHRRGARPGRGDVVRRRAHDAAQVRHERARAARAATRSCWPRRWRRWPSCPAAGCCRRSGSASPTAWSTRRSASSAGERAKWFDEALTVMRKCWYDDVVDHDGERFHYEGLKVRPQPKRLDVWLGGIAPSELRRVGRMADGWLPSFVTPGRRRRRPRRHRAGRRRARAGDRGRPLRRADPVHDGRRARRARRPARPAPARPRGPVGARARRLGRRRSTPSSASSTSARRSSSCCPIVEPADGSVGRPPHRRRRRPPPPRDLTAGFSSRCVPLAGCARSRPRAAIAALRPGMADTPPPRRAPAPHTNTLGCAVSTPQRPTSAASRRTATAGRGGRCGRPACRGGLDLERAHDLDARPGRAGSPRSARRARCRASAGSTPRPRPARRRGRRGTAGPACAGANSVSVWAPAACSSGPRIDGSVSEWQ